MQVDGGLSSDSKRGVKRHADESNLSDDQRFAKRFHLLNLGTGARAQQQAEQYELPHQPIPQQSYDGMQIDDTRDRVYISDIDAEIADIEANEPQERLIFLPDIEKHFSRIPAHVLAGSKTDTPDNQQLVLYDVPRSLTTNAGHDVTRKAIIEARRRAQEKAVDEARKSSGIPITEDLGQGAGNVDSIDPDAMDME